MLTTYTALLTIHILAAATWVGGGVMLVILTTRAGRNREDPSKLAGLVRDIAFVAPRSFIPASLVLIATGFGMIANGNLDYELWVVLALIGWAATFVTGNFFLAPSSHKAVEGLDSRGDSDPETLAAIGRFLRVAQIDQVVLFLVIVDMVIKPT